MKQGPSGTLFVVDYTWAGPLNQSEICIAQIYFSNLFQPLFWRWHTRNIAPAPGPEASLVSTVWRRIMPCCPKSGPGPEPLCVAATVRTASADYDGTRPHSD
jgi:hypothetical protein